MSHRRTFLRLADDHGWGIDSDSCDDLFSRDGMSLAVEYVTGDDRSRFHASFRPAGDGGLVLTVAEFSEVVDLLMLPAGESVRIAR